MHQIDLYLNHILHLTVQQKTVSDFLKTEESLKLTF